MKLLAATFLVHFCITCSGQITFRNHKTDVHTEPSKIRAVLTSHVFITSEDYKPKTSPASPRFEVDYFRELSIVGDSIRVGFRETLYYKDSVMGRVYTVEEMQNEWNKGNRFTTVFPVKRDSVITFPSSEVKRVVFQKKEFKKSAGSGGLILGVVGVGCLIGGTVEAVEGDDVGFIVLGVGVGCLLLTKGSWSSSRWYSDLELGKGGWILLPQQATANRLL